MTQATRTTQSTRQPPGFMVLHGNRLEDLRDLLIEFLRARPLPVLQAEVILVQSNGMKHWLEMALADESALGICAATRMELPGSYLWQVYRSVLGADAVPVHMPFDKNQLLWRLMRLLPQLVASSPVYAPLARYLQGGSDGRRLYQLSQQIADVLDGYQSYRADWLHDWAEGRDALRGHDGSLVPLAEDQRWQAHLWRALRADVGEGLADASRASVHARFMAHLRAQQAHHPDTGTPPLGLPARVVVFGMSSLSMQTVEALALLGQFSQVLMLVQNPCQYFWGDIVEGHAHLRRQLQRRQHAKPPRPGAAQASLFDLERQHAATHPLLASWGKQGRDYLHLLDGFDRVEDYRGTVSRVDAFVDPVSLSARPSQLAQLQSAILHLEPVPAAPLPVAPGDGSITLVSTHSPQREVEVLHDRLLAWLEADAGLQPREVMVMVPDMEVFAPHIHAVFGRFARGQARHIPYSVADTTARQSPLVQALEQLLRLPRARVSLVDWLSLLEVSAVRRRFGLAQADIAQLQVWLARAGVRWGLDAQHRQHWGLPAEVPDRDQNTWAFGLRRLLLGYAVGPGSAWAGTMPQAAIGSLDAGLVSPLLDWLDAIHRSLAELEHDHTPEEWGSLLAGVLERFFAAEGDAEERLIQRILEALEVWQQSCAEAQMHSALSLDVVREHWMSQIAETALQQRFFGGGVQFGTLMPMRSIPFRAICLLGMNDGDYPRVTAPRDFDLMAQSWRAGDRSRREDDRYLFLEAILSARERLYVSWQGHRATDNGPQEPSVLVAQLIDYLNAGWSPPRVVQQQPLQPYSQAYFLQGSDFATFDDEWARVHAGEATATGSPADAIPASAAAPPLALSSDELRRLLRQPVEVFFRSRMHIQLEPVQEALPELEPFALGALERHQIGQALLQAGDAAQALTELRLSGQLPMAAFGERHATQLARERDVVLQRRAAWRQSHAHACAPLAIALDVRGIVLTASLSGLWLAQPADGAGGVLPHGACLQLGERLGAVLEGGVRDRHARGHILVGPWVNHLMACAQGMRLTSVQTGLDGQVVLEPLAPSEALALLEDLVDAYRQAWVRPLPVACKTAWAYLQALASQKDPHETAQAAWEGGHRRAGEWAESPYVARAFDSYQDVEGELPYWAERLYGAMAAHARVVAQAEQGA